MKTLFRKIFLKELAKIPIKTRSKIERFVFKDVPNLKKLGDSIKIEKMSGYPNYYKARFGDYRVGLKLENDEIIFEKVLHRKEIYRYFP